jgi:ATP-dependent exoDNAse (exonuclease V) alpha subunit
MMKQTTALNILKSGSNVFLTGSAGAGKTYTLNQYIQYLKARKVPVAVTASTGIAATHMNGMTIHTWSGIGIKDQLAQSDLKNLKERKYLRDHIEKTKVLIIDEISMLHAKQLNLVNQVLKYFKDTDEPFGGIQVIVAGDFFQLPPVGKSSDQNRDKFCFMSDAWLDARFNICYLTEQHRQQDNELDKILNEIRCGQVSDRSFQVLNNTKNNTLEADITRLYTHNQNVDQINDRHLDGIKHKSQLFTATTKGNEKLLMTLTSSVRAPEQLTLKKGAKVMFVKNNFDEGYINGTLGEIIGFIKDEEYGFLPEVKLRDGSSLIVEPATWSIEDEDGKVIASYTQIPLRLAWAITIHKSQGMTLEAAEIDLTKTFECGQGYVALSRLKSLDGLRLLGINAGALELDRLAMRADSRFQELSLEAEQEWQHRDTKAIHDEFILRSGGTLNSNEIARQQKKLTGKPAETISANTLQQTKDLYDQGLEIEEIAEKRALTRATIINHLSKLYQEDKTLDMSRIKPDDEVIQSIRKAYKIIKNQNLPEHFSEDGTVRLKAIIETLDVPMGYNEVRLALMFVG